MMSIIDFGLAWLYFIVGHICSRMIDGDIDIWFEMYDYCMSKSLMYQHECVGSKYLPWR